MSCPSRGPELRDSLPSQQWQTPTPRLRLPSLRNDCFRSLDDMVSSMGRRGQSSNDDKTKNYLHNDNASIQQLIDIDILTRLIYDVAVPTFSCPDLTNLRADVGKGRACQSRLRRRRTPPFGQGFLPCPTFVEQTPSLCLQHRHPRLAR